MNAIKEEESTAVFTRLFVLIEMTEPNKINNEVCQSGFLLRAAICPNLP